MPFACAVVTVSDRGARGEAEDVSGDLAASLLARCPELEVVERAVVPDDRERIGHLLRELASRCCLVVTTGGTGLGPRDVTPEATLDVIERRLPGLEQAMHAAGRSHTPLAMLSRAVAGSKDRTLFLNLPGSPSGVEDGLRAVLRALPHALELLGAEVTDCAEERRRQQRSDGVGLDR